MHRPGDLRMVQRINALLTEQKLFEEYEDVFEGLGSLPGTHHIELQPDSKPVVHPPQRVPAALRVRVKTELERMERLGVIKSVSQPTDWVSSMVTMVKPNKIRICIDAKDLNRAIKRERYPIPTIEEVISRLPEAKLFRKFDASIRFLADSPG